MHEPIRVVIVGTGQMGAGIARLVLQRPGLALVGAYGRRAERGGLDFVGAVRLPPGAYSLRVFVRGARAADSGLRVLEIEVPAAADERPAMSPPLFRADAAGCVALQQSIAEVNQLQSEADDAVQNLNTGNKKDIHGTLVALEKADISFQLLMQVRNKIVAAYQEIMRMQI